MQRLFRAARFPEEVGELMQKLSMTSIDMILGTGDRADDFLQEIKKMAGEEQGAKFWEDDLRALWHAAKAVELRHSRDDVWALTTGLHIPPRKSESSGNPKFQTKTELTQIRNFN